MCVHVFSPFGSQSFRTVYILTLWVNVCVYVCTGQTFCDIGYENQYVGRERELAKLLG